MLAWFASRTVPTGYDDTLNINSNPSSSEKNYLRRRAFDLIFLTIDIRGDRLIPTILNSHRYV